MPGVPLKDSMRAYGVKPGTINYNAPPPFGPQGAPADFYNVTRPGGQIPVAKPTATPLSPRPAPISGHAQTPLAPSTPTAPDLYRQGLVHSQQYDYGDDSYQGGLMTNFGAGINNMDRKYMPGVTVGGQFGKYNPAPGIAPQANGDIYSPAMRDMVNRGINNARFGNARESTLYDISHPGNGYRPPVEPRGGSVTQVYPRPNATPFTPPDPAEFAKRQGLEFNPQTGVLAGNSPAANMNARQLGNLRAGVNPFAPAASKSQLAANRQSYLAKREEAAKAAPVETPYQKRLAMRQANEQTSFERAFMARNPEAGASLMARRGEQEGLNARTTQTLDAQKYAADSKLIGDLAANGKSATEIAQFMANRNGSTAPLSPVKPIASAKDLPQSEQENLRKLAANKPSEAVRKLKELGYDEDKINEVMREVTGDSLYGVGFMDRPLTPPRGVGRPGMTVREGLRAVINPFAAATQGPPDKTPKVKPRGFRESLRPFVPGA